MTPRMIRVPYTVTRSELAQSKAALFARGTAGGEMRPVGGPWNTLLGWMMFAGCAVLLYVLKPEPIRRFVMSLVTDHFEAMLVAALFLSLFMGLWFWVYVRISRGVRNEDAAFLTIGETGLVYDTKGIRTEWSWGTFKKLIETPSLLILSYEEGKGIVVPRRLFGSDELLLREVIQFIIDRMVPRSVPIRNE